MKTRTEMAKDAVKWPPALAQQVTDILSIHLCYSNINYGSPDIVLWKLMEEVILPLYDNQPKEFPHLKPTTTKLVDVPIP